MSRFTRTLNRLVRRRSETISVDELYAMALEFDR